MEFTHVPLIFATQPYEAVKAGPTLEWSNEQVEGHVHRLKLLMCQMYGKANFQTLRKLVLKYAWQNLRWESRPHIINFVEDPVSSGEVCRQL